MTNILLIYYVFKFTICLSHEPKINLSNTIWQLSGDDYVYLVYYKGNVYEITDYTKSIYPKGGITVTEKRYGFCNSCILPSADSLQESGICYFELNPTDSSNQETESADTFNACGELSFITKNKLVLMNIYYNSHQQCGTYKRINILPKNIQKYLAKNGIKLDFLPRK